MAFGIANFLEDPELLQPWFAGDSWSNWRVVLKGVFAEAMSEAERERFYELADRDPPKSRVREFWACVGRRGGKDSICSAVACYVAALGDFAAYVRPGERPQVLCLAVDRTQAGIVFSYIKGYFERVELLKPLVSKITADTIELTTGVDIVVASSSYRSVRGRTVLLAILDEVAFFREEGGGFVSPDVEIYSALLPSLATLRKVGSMIVGISTVHRKSGLLFQKWRENYARDGDILVIRQPSIVFNPTLSQQDIDSDISLDPQRAEADG
jgi:hypothetical protein